MCVTTRPAKIGGTAMYVFETDFGGDRGLRHVCGYQNQATNLADGANVMLLHFPGTQLEMVRGPETTKQLMRDMTSKLRPVAQLFLSSGGRRLASAYGVKVESYGDYTVVLAQGPADILGVLEHSRDIPDKHRPIITIGLRHMVSFYMDRFPQHSFALPCFDASVKPEHPIVVSYKPHDPTILTAPGLDGHDGRVPTVDDLMPRDFKVAFGIRGHKLPYAVDYQDAVSDLWAPSSVAGFFDNREYGRNEDYRVPTKALRDGLTGVDLLDCLQR